MKTRRAGKGSDPKDENSKKKSKSFSQKLGLDKSFRAALTTNAQLGDQEANQTTASVVDEFPSNSKR